MWPKPYWLSWISQQDSDFLAPVSGLWWSLWAGAIQPQGTGSTSPQCAAAPAVPAADPPWNLALKQSMHIQNLTFLIIIYSNTFNTKLCDTNVWHLSPWYLLHPFLLGFLLHLSPLLPAPLQALLAPVWCWSCVVCLTATTRPRNTEKGEADVLFSRCTSNYFFSRSKNV